MREYVRMRTDSAAASNDLAGHARALLDANRYPILGTTDPDGRPWTSPVYFAASGLREFSWTSMTDARHSQNIAAGPRESRRLRLDRPALARRAVYATAEAYEVPADDVDHALDVYRGPRDPSAAAPARADVIAPSTYRLYRATASDLWVLCPGSRGNRARGTASTPITGPRRAVTAPARPEPIGRA